MGVLSYLASDIHTRPMRKASIVLAGAAALATCLSPVQATAGLLSWLIDAAEWSTERGALRSLEEPALKATKPLGKVPEETAPKTENAHASGAAENSAETESFWEGLAKKINKKAAEIKNEAAEEAAEKALEKKEAAEEAFAEKAVEKAANLTTKDAAKSVNEVEMGLEGWVVLISIFVLAAGLVFVVLRQRIRRSTS